MAKKVPKELTTEESDKQIISQLAKIGKENLATVEAAKNPRLTIPLRTLSNVYFDPKEHIIKLGDKTQTRSFFNVGQAKKYMQTMIIASKIKTLLEQRKPALDTRQLFYISKHTIPGTNENTFDDQASESDPIIEDIEVTINALRERLRLIAVPKGVIAGPLVVEEKDAITGKTQVLDYSKMGSAGGAIPPIVEPNVYKLKKCTADYILVVEKYAVWNLLNQQRYWEKNNCILMTGKGQPARAERRLLSRLAAELKLPVYIFCDMDEYGYYIYSVYKQGSINLAFFSEKSACPSAKYIGFSVDDVKRFNISKDSFIKLTDLDLKRIAEIMSYDWFKKKEWQEELKKLKEFGYKIESDALVQKSIEFTANEYLPKKIKNKQWLE